MLHTRHTHLSLCLSELQQDRSLLLSSVSGLSVSLCFLWRRDTVPPLPLPAPALQPAHLPLAAQLQSGSGAVHAGRGLRQFLLGQTEASGHPPVSSLLLLQQGCQVRRRAGGSGGVRGESVEPWKGAAS